MEQKSAHVQTPVPGVSDGEQRPGLTDGTAAAAQQPPHTPSASGHRLAASAVLLRNQLEHALEDYNTQFHGAFGPVPAVKLYRTLSGLCTDYTDNLQRDEFRSLQWIIRMGKMLSQALPECAQWVHAARRNPAIKHEDLTAVTQLVQCAASAVKQAGIVAEQNQEALHAAPADEAGRPGSSSLAALTANGNLAG